MKIKNDNIMYFILLKQLRVLCIIYQPIIVLNAKHSSILLLVVGNANAKGLSNFRFVYILLEKLL